LAAKGWLQRVGCKGWLQKFAGWEGGQAQRAPAEDLPQLPNESKTPWLEQLIPELSIRSLERGRASLAHLPNLQTFAAPL
jgi:hypothetical protein